MIGRRRTYRLELQAEAGIDDVRALRWLLKVLLRRFGFRCIAIIEVER